MDSPANSQKTGSLIRLFTLFTPSDSFDKDCNKKSCIICILRVSAVTEILCSPKFVTVSDDDEIDYSIKTEFYDSDLDDKDELWMAKKRDGRTSDAVLSCPACFTTVCLECQRHEQYVTQYRAVFVDNCKVDKDRAFQHNTVPSKVGKRRRDSEEKETHSADSERVNSVVCSTCSTEIGVPSEP